jgi:hypothetical protein
MVVAFLKRWLMQQAKRRRVSGGSAPALDRLRGTTEIR